MSTGSESFRRIIARDSCTLAANIFDPLSARIADMLGYELCVLSGSVGKAANLAVPDGVLSNMSDVVDHCHRINRVGDITLMVDAEDGFGNAVNVTRTVRELEAAGVAAIEIEDNFVPKRFNHPHPGLVSKEEQVGKLEAAVASRSDPSTVIVARSAALGEVSMEEALDRIAAYSETGAEAVMLTGARSREQLEAVHGRTSLPLAVLSPPREIREDSAFLAANGVRILMLGNPTYAVAVKAIHESLLHLLEGGSMEDLAGNQAPAELLRGVNRSEEFLELQDKYLRQ